MLRTNISLPEEMMEWVRDYGYHHKLSLSGVVRQAIDQLQLDDALGRVYISPPICRKKASEPLPRDEG